MRFIVGDHELDLQRQEVRRGTERVHVEPRVFDLLVYLIQHRERVVGKDELFDRIWQGRIVSDAALSSSINAARRALNDDGERQALIKTAHRRGFRFVGEVRQEAVQPVVAHAAAPSADPAPLPARQLSGPASAADRKPSIAVLPFVNLSPEADTEYFIYGLTEDIIRLLARYSWLDVLSRHSGAAFRGRDVEAREIGASLAVRYLVQGSVLKRGERVRISADLVSAESGRHLWSQSYDFALLDLFDVQDAMAQQIAAVIEPELARMEREAAMRKPPASLDAWDSYQRGLFHLWGFTTPSMAEGEEMFRRAIALDPGFARGHGALAYVLLHGLVMGDPARRPALIEEALEHARIAVALDDRDCMNQCVLGRIRVVQRRPEEGVAALEQAIQLNPSFAQGYYALGHALIWCGRAAEAMEPLERAMRLSPQDPHLSDFCHVRAMAHFALRESEAALSLARRAVRFPNAKYRAHVVLAATLGQLGQSREAAAAMQRVYQDKPGYDLAHARDDYFFSSDDGLLERLLQGLRNAGVPGRDRGHKADLCVVRA